HVEGVQDELAKRVVRRAQRARLVLDRNGIEPGRAPREQDVDRDVRTVVAGECVTDPGAEYPKRSRLAGDGRAHRGLQRDLGDLAREVAPQPVRFLRRWAVDDVDVRGELLE